MLVENMINIWNNVQQRTKLVILPSRAVVGTWCAILSLVCALIPTKACATCNNAHWSHHEPFDSSKHLLSRVQILFFVSIDLYCDNLPGGRTVCEASPPGSKDPEIVLSGTIFRSCQISLTEQNQLRFSTWGRQLPSFPWTHVECALPGVVEMLLTARLSRAGLINRAKSAKYIWVRSGMDTFQAYRRG